MTPWLRFEHPPTGRPRNKQPIMSGSSRSACSVLDLLTLTWPVVKLLMLSPPPPTVSSHVLHNYSLSDGVIITAEIKSGFRSAPVFLLWLYRIYQAAAAAAATWHVIKLGVKANVGMFWCKPQRFQGPQISLPPTLHCRQPLERFKLDSLGDL